MIWLYVSIDANGVVIFTHITLKEDFLFICIGEKSFHSRIQKGGKWLHLQAKLQETKREVSACSSTWRKVLDLFQIPNTFTGADMPPQNCINYSLDKGSGGTKTLSASLKYKVLSQKLSCTGRTKYILGREKPKSLYRSFYIRKV